MSEITSVLAVSELESVDKMACYKVDHYILSRLLHGYEIPTVSHISVDEGYARGPKQQKKARWDEPTMEPLDRDPFHSLG